MYPEVKKTLLALFAAAAIPSMAIDVDTLKVAGPYCMNTPIQTDTADVWGKAFDFDKMLMDKTIVPQMWKQGKACADGILPAQNTSAVSLAGFQLENSLFAKCKIVVKGAGSHKVYINGKEGAEQNLTPGRHDIVVKVLQKANKADTLKISVESAQEKYITINPTGKRLYALEDYLHGERASTTSLSSSGRYMLLNTYTTRSDGKTEWSKKLVDLKENRELPIEGFKQWASTGDRYIRSRKGSDMGTIYEYVNPESGEITPLFTDYSGKSGQFLPGEQLMLISDVTEGPKEDKKVHQILEPDDRIAGWRNRYNAMVMDVKTGQILPLTTGQKNTSANVSDDGSKILLTINESCITERPFSFSTILLVDRNTLKVDTLVKRDGFVNEARFSPDGKQVVMSGSPEALNGIGKNDPTGKIPSMTQTELYLMNLDTREIKPITFDFNPSVEQWRWNRADGNIYALCENHDRKDLFRLNMKSLKWEQLKLSENSIASFDLADEKPLLTYTGQSESNSDRVYKVDLKNDRETLLYDFDKPRMGDIALGKCQEWNFQSSRGDSIYGRFYLPPHFDANKKYPMLVYYYGGCSPVGRNLDSYYNFHGWASMNYVVYVIQPSGCTGFGQEFAARHVNAYGKYTADDIIEGTKKFCLEHPYVNDKKIGCLGASYGGFMTMYLQTQTDIFAAAMSHAGISNPASYWGFGYWGYSYNAICAAHSYPWNNTELMSGNSPLFNADKIHTPILFLHGEADTNVPINESIQLFNALKILGRECAFVAVEGQNHHILDYEKRIKWVHTFYAWFAKWLQDDPTWWDTMYPKKNLK